MGSAPINRFQTLIVQQTNVAYTEEDVKQFASYLEQDGDLFYKTPLEKNITLRQKLSNERQKRSRFQIADVTNITLHTWPRADDYLTRIQPYFEFLYNTWFILLTLVLFGVMGWMWADKFGEIWRDSFAFFNFTEKSNWDLVELWFLFGALAFFHEAGHGLTCKHFGARVEKMQLLLMYFEPTFVCDCTQVWILGGRKAQNFHYRCRHLDRPDPLHVRHRCLVGHRHRDVRPRLSLQSHDDHGYRRIAAEPEPVDQAGRLLLADGNYRRRRFERTLHRLRLQLDAQTYFSSAGGS